MLLYPAIDLRDGHCVRLYQGDFAQETVYGDDPVAQAKLFAAAGSEWVHVVDLDAARTGESLNRRHVAAIAERTSLRVQSGGGVRDEASATALLDAGVDRVVIGTAAVEDPEWAKDLAGRNPGRVALGLDVRGREVSVRGWQAGSGQQIAQLASNFDDAGFAALIVTQIDVDGVGSGPDVDLYRELLGNSATPLIASGGVGSAQHLEGLASLTVNGRRLNGAIVGKALYEGDLSIESALSAVLDDA